MTRLRGLMGVYNRRGICLIEYSPDRLRFLVEGYPLPLVNAVRRACFTDVPVMAVDYVEIFENNTFLYDEIIAHRLALIPLTSEGALGKYKPPEECREGDIGDTGCYAVLRLEVETGPTEERIVYSGDIETLDPDIRVVYKNIPIVVMAPGQRLSLQAYARLGYGKEHAKWMPVSIAAHKYVPVVEFNVDEADGECLSCIETGYPWLVEKMKKLGKGRIELVEEDVNTSALYWCVEKKCNGRGVRLHYDDTRFIVTIEATGALTSKRVILEAVNAIIRKAENILTQLEKLREQAREKQG